MINRGRRVIGVDLYNLAVTGDVAMTVRVATQAHDSVPNVVIEESEMPKQDERKPVHPSPFSEAVLAFVAQSGLLPERGLLLDPFAGVGRIHWLATERRKTVGVEIEPEWAACHPSTICGNALDLPFEDSSVDCVLTSPCYGNRMSDRHHATDGSTRRSYTHDLRRMTGDLDRELQPENSGVLYAWQSEYWEFHKRAWSEVLRVLKPGRRFLLNVSDFFRSGELVPLAKNHAILCCELGFELIEEHPIETRRYRYGANSELRAAYEVVLELVK